MSTPPFLELPAGVEATRIDTGRGPLAALRGHPSVATRPPVLLVPGFTGSKEDFIAVLSPLATAGHPVVAIDQRGQFESPGEDDPSAYDLKALAEDVVAVGAGLGQPVHLVGHSFGGLVARAAALAEPARWASLTLLGSGPGPIPHPSATNLELIVQALPVMDLESIWQAKRELERPHETTPIRPEIEEWMHRRFLANHPTCLRRMAEQLLGESDRVAELAELSLPTLVLHGSADDAWPPEQQADMARRLGAEHFVVPEVGHSPAAEAPDDTAVALLDFFASVSG